MRPPSQNHTNGSHLYSSIAKVRVSSIRANLPHYFFVILHAFLSIKQAIQYETADYNHELPIHLTRNSPTP